MVSVVSRAVTRPLSLRRPASRERRPLRLLSPLPPLGGVSDPFHAGTTPRVPHVFNSDITVNPVTFAFRSSTIIVSGGNGRKNGERGPDRRRVGSGPGRQFSRVDSSSVSILIQRENPAVQGGREPRQFHSAFLIVMPAGVECSVTQSPKSIREPLGVLPADTHQTVLTLPLHLQHGMG
jgi:hypothetical protein